MVMQSDTYFDLLYQTIRCKYDVASGIVYVEYVFLTQEQKLGANGK